MVRFHPARFTSWLMFGSAFSLFLYVGSNVAYTADSQATLTQIWDRTHPNEPTTHGGSDVHSDNVDPSIFFQHPRLQYGESLAKITVPAIQFVGVVLEGTDLKVLAGGPGHVPETAYPGEPDNVVITNHNSYSLSWAKLKADDLIILQTSYGTYKYRITRFAVVEANDYSVEASTRPRPTMTFLTCWPLYLGALASQRYAVFAEMVQ